MESEAKDTRDEYPIGHTTNIDEVKSFYKENLPKIFKSIFTEPIKGTYELFSVRTEKSYQNSIFLILTTGILFTVLPLIAAGNSRSYLGMKPFVLMGLTAILCLFLISILSFIIKSISGRADFKNELLTGGLCGIPLFTLISILFIFNIFSDGILEILMHPLDIFRGGILISLLIVYCLLSMINIFQQSLKSSGTNDAISWYISPIGILFALYLTSKIMFETLQ